MKRTTTATFLLELPVQVDSSQARRLHAHLEVARTFYNALLGEARTRLRRMRADPAWQAARALPRRLKSPVNPQQEPVSPHRETGSVGEPQEPPRIHAGEVSVWIA